MTRANGCSWNKRECINVAANRGHLRLLKWFKEIGCTFSRKVVKEANRGGYLEVVEWLQENTN